MNGQLQRYLTLESIALQLDRTGDSYADVIRDQMDAIWDALDDSERAWLDSRGYLSGPLAQYETSSKIPRSPLLRSTGSTRQEPPDVTAYGVRVLGITASSSLNVPPPDARKVA